MSKHPRQLFIYLRACALRSRGGKCEKGGEGHMAGAPRSAVCRLVAISEGWQGRGGGCEDVSAPVCGNPALLTSHTLFSRSYKPLMPQKMLGLLWPGTAEEGGHWGGGGRPGRRGLVELSMAAVAASPPVSSLFLFSAPVPVSSPHPSALLPPSSSLFNSAPPLSSSREDWAGLDLGEGVLIVQKN